MVHTPNETDLFVEGQAPGRPSSNDRVLHTVPDRVSPRHQAGPCRGTDRHAVVVVQLQQEGSGGGGMGKQGRGRKGEQTSG